MGQRVTRLLIRSRYIVASLLLTAPFLNGLYQPVYAAPQVQERYDKISDSEVSAVATHLFGFRYTDLTNPVGSVGFEFCSNSPLVDIPCVAPTGLDLNTIALASQSGETGFAINGPVSTANKIVITRGAQVPQAGSATSTYEFTGVTNPDTFGSYYVRIQTYSSTDTSGAALEEGGVVFALNSAFDLSAEVPPYLKFCASVTITGYDCSTATSFFIDLGEFSKTSPKSASSEMVVATNAPFGFSISLAGTTLTSGNNLIPSLNSPSPSSPGTSQFGLNLQANSNPSIGAPPNGPGTAGVTGQYAIPNLFKFVPGDTVAGSAGTTDNRKFTVSYITNVSNSQSAGIYATTVSFIALANF